MNPYSHLSGESLIRTVQEMDGAGMSYEDICYWLNAVSSRTLRPPSPAARQFIEAFTGLRADKLSVWAFLYGQQQDGW